MASGSKIRALARLLDASREAVWAIGPAGRLVYISDGAAAWLGIDGDRLVDRLAVAGSTESPDPLDRLAAALAPPAGLNERGTARLRVAPPPLQGREIGEMDTRFIRVGQGERAVVVAVGGQFQDAVAEPELAGAVAVRQRLDAWRRRQGSMATIATAGTSTAARRTRARLRVAAGTRTHVGFFGPAGCGAESMARQIHQLAAGDEPLGVVDGPLMDAELLDATLMPLVHTLADSESAQATALVRGLDEMPAEAQQRLVELLSGYGPRMRLLALCASQPAALVDPLPSDADAALPETPPQGIDSRLIDLLSTLCVSVAPLAGRVEDIPLIAAALLDARHAAGEGTAERLSRSALDALVIYPWPGNFEELDHTIRHAIGTAPHQVIGSEHLPLAVRSYRPGESARRGSQPSVPLDEAVKRYELRRIHQAIEAAGGNRAEAARRLGISRARLLRRLEDDDTERPSTDPSA